MSLRSLPNVDKLDSLVERVNAQSAPSRLSEEDIGVILAARRECSHDDYWEKVSSMRSSFTVKQMHGLAHCRHEDPVDKSLTRAQATAWNEALPEVKAYMYDDGDTDPDAFINYWCPPSAVQSSLEIIPRGWFSKGIDHASEVARSVDTLETDPGLTPFCCQLTHLALHRWVKANGIEAQELDDEADV